MRNLSPIAITSLMFRQPSEHSRTLAELRMAVVKPKTANTDWLSHGVKEGWLVTTELTYAGESIAVLWFHVSPDGGLIVNAIGSTSNVINMPVIVSGIEKLAANNNCRYVEFCTARQGIIAQAAQYGYFAESVVLRKHL